MNRKNCLIETVPVSKQFSMLWIDCTTFIAIWDDATAKSDCCDQSFKSCLSTSLVIDFTSLRVRIGLVKSDFDCSVGRIPDFIVVDGSVLVDVSRLKKWNIIQFYVPTRGLVKPNRINYRTLWTDQIVSNLNIFYVFRDFCQLDVHAGILLGEIPFGIFRMIQLNLSFG